MERRGKEFGLLPYGVAAMQSLRIEKALPLAGPDIDGEQTPFEVGLAKWIDFIEGPSSIKVTEKGKPLRELGFIGWYPQWRKFCFIPNAHTIYEQDCLRDIANYCEAKTKERKDK